MLGKKDAIEFIDPPKDKKEQRSINLKNYLDGSLITRRLLIQNFYFVLLLAGMALILIANRYQAEKILREKIRVQNQLKEMRSESITVSAKFMEVCRQSSVSKIVNERGLNLKEPNVPAKKLTTDQ